jgi:ABC-type branched-subunit amino acid transport system substrate-binding protein
VREIPAAIGATVYLLKQEKNLHGAFLIPGDLPTTVQASMTQIAAQKNAGINLNQTPKVSGFSEQSAYTPIVQQLRADQSNYLYDGSNDKAMVNARKEAKAQGVDSVKYWMCSLACYTDAFLTSGGADVEGTYASMQFLPFEDKGSNAELDAFLANVKKPDSWAAQSWQAATVFKQLIDGIVAKSGVNGITRASLLDALKNAGEVDAGGWMGKKSLRGTSSCVVVLQVQNGKWARVFPTEKGTMDCTSVNLTKVSIDPVAEAAKLG